MKKLLISLLLSLALLLSLGAAVHGEARLDYVTDGAGLLTEAEVHDLQSRAARISEQYSCGVYIVVVDDYVTPNTMVDAGDVFANYFAHQPYQDDFNAQNGTKLVTIAGVHVEPMGLYAGKQADLGALGLK